MTSAELSLMDEEVLGIITRFEAATERHMEDAMSQLAARQWVYVVAEYDVPGAPLSEGTQSLIAQLQRVMTPVPSEDWRSAVALIANEAKRQLMTAGKWQVRA